ncbi:hypothetical protein GCM10022205_54380 [Spinactinospora alkalitolerans]
MLESPLPRSRGWGVTWERKLPGRPEWSLRVTRVDLDIPGCFPPYTVDWPCGRYCLERSHIRLGAPTFENLVMLL